MCSLVFVLAMEEEGTNKGQLLLGWGLSERDALGDVAF